MRKKSIIREQQLELDSRNNDIWKLFHENHELRIQIAVLEAMGEEQERNLLEQAKVITALKSLLERPGTTQRER
jgi:hypothetical protein